MPGVCLISPRARLASAGRVACRSRERAVLQLAAGGAPADEIGRVDPARIAAALRDGGPPVLHAELDASAQHVFAVAADRAESRAYAGTADLAVALIDEAATVLDELRVDRLAVRQALLERSSAG